MLPTPGLHIEPLESRKCSLPQFLRVLGENEIRIEIEFRNPKKV